jgi:hypothetical protein
MDYILNEIVDRTDKPFYEVVRYCADKFRSIRADYTVQQLYDPVSIEVHEQMCRFHIFAAHAMADESTDSFDPVQNMEKVAQCLVTITSAYKEQRSKGVYTPNQAEFFCYYLLLLLSKQASTAVKQISDIPPGLFQTTTKKRVNLSHIHPRASYPFFILRNRPLSRSAVCHQSHHRLLFS